MSIDPAAAPPVPQERAPGEWRGIVVRLAVALIVLVGGYVGLAYFLGGRIPAGTAVEGVDIGTLSEDSARSVLSEKLADTANEPVVLDLEGERARLDPAESGLSLDLDQTLGGVAGVSFDPRNMWAHLTGDGRDLALATDIDRPRLEQSLQNANEEIAHKPVQGAVVLSRGKVKTTLPEEGVEIDVPGTAEEVESAWPQKTSITATSLSLKTDLTREQIEAFVADYADPALGEPVVVRVEDENAKATISPNQLSRLLSVEEADDADGNRGLSLAIDEEGLADIVGGGLVDIEQRPQDAALRLSDRGRPEIVDAVIGKEINEGEVLDGVGEILKVGEVSSASSSTQAPTDDASSTSDAAGSTADADEATATSDAAERTASPEDTDTTSIDGRTITVSVTEVEPEIGDKEAADWDVDAVMAEFTSEFPTGAENEARTENIRVGLRYVNGSVVMPGEQFNLANTLAPISKDRGYVNAGVIADGRLVKGIGGGLSQVSTTLLNAAWFSGVELNAFTPHSYYISRYPVGREATISVGAIDNVWTNDTTSPIVIQTFIEGDEIVMRFYGDRQYRVETRTGSRRDVTEPDKETDDSPDCLTQGAVDGFTITVARDLIKSGDVVRTDEYTTTYKPSPAVTCTDG